MSEANAAHTLSTPPSAPTTSATTTTRPRGSNQAPRPHQQQNNLRNGRTVGGIDAGPSVQRMSRVYATTAEAIANFRPTPREVINGLAPHVFDERKRRRSQHRSRSPKPYWYSKPNGERTNGEKPSSPLRGATIISWDEHSIYLEQSDPSRNDSTDKLKLSESTTSVHIVRDVEPAEQIAPQRTIGVGQRAEGKVDKSGWRYFRVDIRSLKSVVDKLKSPPSQNPSSFSKS